MMSWLRAKLRSRNAGIEAVPWDRSPAFLIHRNGPSNTVLKNLIHVERLRNENDTDGAHTSFGALASTVKVGSEAPGISTLHQTLIAMQATSKLMNPITDIRIV